MKKPQEAKISMGLLWLFHFPQPLSRDDEDFGRLGDGHRRPRTESRPCLVVRNARRRRGRPFGCTERHAAGFPVSLSIASTICDITLASIPTRISSHDYGLPGQRHGFRP